MWRISTVVVILIATTFLNGKSPTPENELSRKSLKDSPGVIADWKRISNQLIDETAMNMLLIDD